MKWSEETEKLRRAHEDLNPVGVRNYFYLFTALFGELIDRYVDKSFSFQLFVFFLVNFSLRPCVPIESCHYSRQSRLKLPLPLIVIAIVIALINLLWPYWKSTVIIIDSLVVSVAITISGNGKF